MANPVTKRRLVGATRENGVRGLRIMGIPPVAKAVRRPCHVNIIYAIIYVRRRLALSFEIGQGHDELLFRPANPHLDGLGRRPELLGCLLLGHAPYGGQQ